MSSDIALTRGQRSNLLSLQDTARLTQRTQVRLATGKAVNEVTDDALKFFQGKALFNRADDFGAYKDIIDQAISSVKTALHALESIEDILKQLDGIAIAAASQSQVERAGATQSFLNISNQISEVIIDATYQGRNLLNHSDRPLNVQTGEDSEFSVLSTDINVSTTSSIFTLVAGVFAADGTVNFSAIGGIAPANTLLEGFTNIGDNTSAISRLEAFRGAIDGAIDQVRTRASAFGSSVAYLQIRFDFNNLYVNELAGGSDKLVLADLNEEGANLVALQTRQQLGIQSLAISGQQQQSIVQLLQ